MAEKYAASYEYLCSNGHSIGANAEVSVCPMYRKGSPCDGSLTRIGKGSRKQLTATAEGGSN